MLKFRELSLQRKLSQIFIYVLVGFFVYFAANIIVSRINRFYLVHIRDKAYPLLERADSGLTLLEKLKANFTEAMVNQEGNNLQIVEQLASRLRKSFQDIKIIDPSMSVSVDRIQNLFDSYYSESKDLGDLLMLGSSDPAELRRRGQVINKKFIDLQHELADFREIQFKNFSNTIAHAKAASDNALLIGFIMFIFAVFACFFAMKVVVQIVRSLDKMGRELQGSAEKLAGTSETVHRSGAVLSDNTREQSEAAAETVSTVVQIQETLEKNVRESEVALVSAHQTLLNAKEGRDLVRNMLVEMAEIEKANSQLNRIVKVMEQIVEKTNIINEIVLQSRILSFNANIEAARAGEFGKGFSVVASEVAKLADLTGTASVDIQELLEKSTKEVFELIQNTNQKVRAGQESSANCESAFESISHHIVDLADKVEFIVNTSKIQVGAVQQITQAMRLVDEAALKNYGSVSKTVDVTGELDGQSAELLENVVILNELVKGTEKSALNIEEKQVS